MKIRPGRSPQRSFGSSGFWLVLRCGNREVVSNVGCEPCAGKLQGPAYQCTQGDTEVLRVVQRAALHGGS